MDVVCFVSLFVSVPDERLKGNKNKTFCLEIQIWLYKHKIECCEVQGAWLEFLITF